jgi:hypothetical protein
MDKKVSEYKDAKKYRCQNNGIGAMKGRPGRKEFL